MSNEMDDLVKNLNRIEIKSCKEKTIYDNPIQIKDFFVSRLKHENIIEIELE